MDIPRYRARRHTIGLSRLPLIVMNPIEAIRKKLSRYPDLDVEETEDTITVKAQTNSGFDVTFVELDKEYIVYFAGWHEHFTKEHFEDALNCFAFGLSDSCRIKQYSKNGEPYMWILESHENGEWSNDSTTGLISLRFFRKPEITYLQNNIITGQGS